jgi:uncharacterized protein (DUF1778 family)
LSAHAYIFNGYPLDINSDVFVLSYSILPYNVCTVWQIAVHNMGAKMPAVGIAKRTERLDARVTREEKSVIERAASLRGISVTDLLRTSVTDAATRIIQESETLALSERERQAFVQSLLNPPRPNTAAASAVKRYRREVR